MNDHLIGTLRELAVKIGRTRHVDYAATVEAAAFILEFLSKHPTGDAMGLIAKELEIYRAKTDALAKKLADQAAVFAAQKNATSKEIADLIAQKQESDAALADANTRAATLQIALDAATTANADLQAKLDADPIHEDAADVAAVKAAEEELKLDDNGDPKADATAPASAPAPDATATPEAPQIQG